MKLSLVVMVSLAAAPIGGQAWASYDYSFISDPSGTFGTTANGINNSGEVVGSYLDSVGENGFTDIGNTFNNFDAGGGTVANGVSAAGLVIGSTTDGSGLTHGFTASPPAYTTFDEPFAGATGATFATGFDQAGNIAVGYFFDPSNVSHGWLSSGTTTQIDVPAATSTVLTGANNAGTSVGYYTDATGTHGFVRTAGGSFTPIDDPAAVNGTFVTGINDLGQITGYYVDGSGVTHGFVLTGSTFVTIDAPGALDLTQVNGINDAGEIVGYAISAATGLEVGFTATVPEPATLSVLGFGAMALVTARRRRRA